MKEITKTLYVCEFCGFEHENKQFMEVHEECCALNPQNQPCSMCSNMILGFGCSKNMPMNQIGGNTLCFYYSKGIPVNPLENLASISKNNFDGDNNDENN